MKVLVSFVIVVVIVQCVYSSDFKEAQLNFPRFYSSKYERFARHIRQKKHFDWQIADPTEQPESTTRPATTSTFPPPEMSTVNVTSMLIRDGTVQINPDEIMHTEEAEGIGDVGLILWGGNRKADNKKHVEATVSEVKKSITRKSTQQFFTEIPKVLEAETMTKKNISSEIANENLELSTAAVIDHTTHIFVETSTKKYLPMEINTTEPSFTTTKSNQLSIELIEEDTSFTEIGNETTIKTSDNEQSPTSHVPQYLPQNSADTARVPSTTSNRPVVGNNVIAILAQMIATPDDIKILNEIGNVQPAITESPAIMIIPSEPTSTESNIEKIMDTMPSANEDVIRVVKLKQDQRYGKGMAKPKYISMALAHMNSTEYDENDKPITTSQRPATTSQRPAEMSNSTSMTMETRSEYSISVAA